MTTTTSIEQIKADLALASAAARKAAAAATKAQKVYDEARRAKDRLQVQLKQVEEATDAGAAKRQAAGDAMRAKIVARLEKYGALTFPEMTRWYADARIKGGWVSSVSIRHNMVPVPPGEQTTEDFLEEYNEDSAYHVYDTDDLPEYITKGWPYGGRYEAPTEALIMAHITYQPTGMDETARVSAGVQHEVAIDVDGPAPTTGELLAVWDAAWAKMLNADLLPNRPYLIA